MISSTVIVILNQLLDIVLGTVTEVGGIGSMKFGMGVIVNTLISRAHNNCIMAA